MSWSRARPSSANRPALSFLSLDSNAGPGFSRLWLMLEDTRDGRNLVLMRRMQAPDQWFASSARFWRAASPRSIWPISALARRASRQPGATAGEGRRTPPELVRVALTLASDGGYAWPTR